MSKVFQPKISFHDSTTGAISSVTIDDETLNSIESPGKVELKFDYDNVNDVDSDGNVKYVDRGDVVSELMKSIGNAAIFDVPTIIKPSYNYTENIGEFEASSFNSSVPGCNHVRTVWELSAFDDFNDRSSTNKNVIITVSSGDLSRVNIGTYPKGDIFYCRCTYVASLNGEEISLTSTVRTIFTGNTDKLEYDGIKNQINSLDVSSGLMSVASLCYRFGWISDMSQYTSQVEERFMRHFNKIGSIKKEFKLDSQRSSGVKDLMVSFSVVKGSANVNNMKLRTSSNDVGLKIVDSQNIEHRYSLDSNEDVKFKFDSIFSDTVLMSIRISFVDENFNDVFNNFDADIKLLTSPFMVFCKKSGSGRDDSILDLVTSGTEFDIGYDISKLSKNSPVSVFVEYEFYSFLSNYKYRPIMCNVVDKTSGLNVGSSGFMGIRNRDFNLEVRGCEVTEIAAFIQDGQYYDVDLTRNGEMQVMQDKTVIPFNFSLNSKEVPVGGPLYNGTYKIFGVATYTWIEFVIDFRQDKDGEIFTGSTSIYYQVSIGEDLGLEFYNLGSLLVKNTDLTSPYPQNTVKELVVINKTSDDIYDFGFNAGCNNVVLDGYNMLIGFSGETSMFSSELDFLTRYIIALPYQCDGVSSAVQYSIFHLAPGGSSSIPVEMTQLPSSGNGHSLYYGCVGLYIPGRSMKIKKHPTIDKFYTERFNFIKSDADRGMVINSPLIASGYININVNFYLKMITFGPDDSLGGVDNGGDIVISGERISKFVSSSPDARYKIDFDLFNKCSHCRGYHNVRYVTFNILGDKKYNDTIYKSSSYPSEYKTNGVLDNRIEPYYFSGYIDYYGVNKYRFLGDGVQTVVRSLPNNSGVGIDSNESGVKIASIIRTSPLNKRSTLSVKYCESGNLNWRDEDFFIGDFSTDLKFLINDREIEMDQYVFEFIIKDSNMSPFKLDFHPSKSILGIGNICSAFGVSSYGEIPSFAASIEDLKDMSLGDNTLDVFTFVELLSDFLWASNGSTYVGTFTQNSSLTTSIAVSNQNSNISLSGVSITSPQSNVNDRYGCYDIISCSDGYNAFGGELDSYVGGIFVFDMNNKYTINNLNSLNSKYRSLCVYNPTSTTAIRNYYPYLSPHVISSESREVRVFRRYYDSYYNPFDTSTSYNENNMSTCLHYLLVKGIGGVSVSPLAYLKTGNGLTNSILVPRSSGHNRYLSGSNRYSDPVFTRVPKLLNSSFSITTSEESVSHAGRFVCSAGDFLKFFYNNPNNDSLTKMFKTDSTTGYGVWFSDLSEMKPVNRVEFRLIINSGNRYVEIRSYDSSGGIVESIKIPFNTEGKFFSIFKIYANRGGALDFENSFFRDLVYYDTGKDVDYVATTQSVLSKQIPTFTTIDNVNESCIAVLDFGEPSFCWVGYIGYNTNYCGSMMGTYAGINTAIINPSYPAAYMWYDSLSVKRRSGSYSGLNLENSIVDFCRYRLGYLLRLGVEELPTCRISIGDFYKLINGRSGSTSQVSAFIYDQVINNVVNGRNLFVRAYSSENNGNYYDPSNMTATSIECWAHSRQRAILFSTRYSISAPNQAIDKSNPISVGCRVLGFVLFRDSSTTNGQIDGGWVVIPSMRGKDTVTQSNLISVLPSIRTYKDGEIFNVYRGPKSNEPDLSGLQSGKRYDLEIFGGLDSDFYI